MKKIIDAMGKACPIPVVETKKALGTLREGDEVEVAVDNDIAVQNLQKMAEQKKIPCHAEKLNDNHYVVTLSISKKVDDIKGAPLEILECNIITEPDNTVVVIASDKMGEGEEKLGRILMKGFVYALTEQDSLPKTILLYNSGAYLSTESSDSISDLKFLESQGVEILTCGTCLNHYGLSENLAVGSVTNMYVILEKQMQATKIVKP